VLEGKSVPEIKTKFDDVYMMALKTNWTVWPAFQAVNFGLIPLPYRLPAQQGAGILWTVFLSMANARQDRKAEVEAILHEKDEKPKV
jgi:protein Mpv17